MNHDRPPCEVRTHYQVYDPLAAIPKHLWPNMILRKAHHLRQAIQTHLDDAMDMLADLEFHEAWNVAEMRKDVFLQFCCGIQPEDLATVRAGYELMRGRGSTVPDDMVTVRRSDVETMVHLVTWDDPLRIGEEDAAALAERFRQALDGSATKKGDEE